MNKEKEIEEIAKELHCATNESFISCRKIKAVRNILSQEHCERMSIKARLNYKSLLST